MTPKRNVTPHSSRQHLGVSDANPERSVARNKTLETGMKRKRKGAVGERCTSGVKVVRTGAPDTKMREKESTGRTCHGDYLSKGVPLYVADTNPSYTFPTHFDISDERNRLYICDHGLIREFDTTRKGEGRQICIDNYIPVMFQKMPQEGGVSITNNWSLVISETANHRIKVFNLETRTVIRYIGSCGSREGHLRYPAGISCDKEGNIHICDRGNMRIQTFNAQGTAVRVFGCDDEMDEWDPCDVAVLSNGNVVVTDIHGSLEIFTSDGIHTTTIEHIKLKEPFGVATDADDNKIVTDFGYHKVHVFRPSGDYVCSWGRQGARPGEFNDPVGVACASDGRVFVADQGNKRIQVF